MAETQEEVTGGAEETAFVSSEFENLLKKEFRPKSEQAKSAVEQAVKTLASQALANTELVSDDALRTIAEMSKDDPDLAKRRSSFSIVGIAVLL